MVEHINRVDPASAPQDVESIRAQLQQALSENLGSTIQTQVMAGAHPQRNERLLQQLYPAAENAEEGQ